MRSPRKSIGEGVGLLGLVVRVELAYETDVDVGPPTVVIKFAHPVPANRRDRDERPDVRARGHVLPSDRAARGCPQTRVLRGRARTLETGEAIVVLEDLRGYRAGDQVEGCDAETAKDIIDAFVPLHATFWGDTDRDILATAMRIDGEYIEGFSPAPEGTWRRAVEMFGHCMTDYVRDGIERYIGSIRELHTLMGARTKTLVHGDVRLDNVMFGEEEGHHKIMLVDWQAIMVSNPLQDLAYLVSQNVRTEERRAHEVELLHHYHDRLLERGIENYSFEQCVDDYDVAVLYLLSYPIVVAGAFDPANERGRLLAEAFLGRSAPDRHRPRPLLPVAGVLDGPRRHQPPVTHIATGRREAASRPRSAGTRADHRGGARRGRSGIAANVSMMYGGSPWISVNPPFSDRVSK